MLWRTELMRNQLWHRSKCYVIQAFHLLTEGTLGLSIRQKCILLTKTVIFLITLFHPSVGQITLNWKKINTFPGFEFVWNTMSWNNEDHDFETIQLYLKTNKGKKTPLSSLSHLILGLWAVPCPFGSSIASFKCISYHRNGFCTGRN